MGNDYLRPPFKKLAVAASGHNPGQPAEQIKPASISSRINRVAAELADDILDVVHDMEVIQEQHQQQQQQQPIVAIAPVAVPVHPEPSRQAKWGALLDVCTMMYEKLLEEERAATERALINGGELPVAQNVTIGNHQDQQQQQQQQQESDYSDDDDDDDDDDAGCLVIDEGAESSMQSEVTLHNSKRATVIQAVPRHVAPSTGSSDSEPQPSTSSSAGSGASGSGSGSQAGSSSVSHSTASDPQPKRKRPAIRRPKHMSQLTLDPNVPFQVEVRYNKNMARKFPGTENRTAEQQALRARNTIAARQSRAKLRVLDEILTNEAEHETMLNEFLMERMSACCAYANTLREVQGLEAMDFMLEFEKIKDQYVVEPLRAQHRVPKGQGPRPVPRLPANFFDLNDDDSDDDDEDDDNDDGVVGDQNEREDGARSPLLPWGNFPMPNFPMIKHYLTFDFRKRDA